MKKLNRSILFSSVLFCMKHLLTVLSI